MAAFDLAATMDALAENLGSIDGLRAYAYPPGSVTPPAAIVGYPEGTFDFTNRRSADEATFPVWIVVGKAVDRAARDQIAQYLGGDSDVKTALDGRLPVGETPTPTVQVCRVAAFTVETIAIGAIDYLAIRYSVEIIS